MPSFLVVRHLHSAKFVLRDKPEVSAREKPYSFGVVFYRSLRVWWTRDGWSVLPHAIDEVSRTFETPCFADHKACPRVE